MYEFLFRSNKFYQLTSETRMRPHWWPPIRASDHSPVSLQVRSCQHLLRQQQQQQQFNQTLYFCSLPSPPPLFFWTPFFSLQVTLFFVIRSSSSVQERLLTKRTGTSSSWPQRWIQPVKCQGYAMTNILGELRLCKPSFWQLRMKNWLYRLILFQRQVLNAFLVALQVSHSPECQDVLRFLGHWCGAPQNPSYSFNWVLHMFSTVSFDPTTARWKEYRKRFFFLRYDLHTLFHISINIRKLLLQIVNQHRLLCWLSRRIVAHPRA